MTPYNDGYFMRKMKKPNDHAYVKHYKKGYQERIYCLARGTKNHKIELEEQLFCHKKIAQYSILSLGLIIMFCCYLIAIPRQEKIIHFSAHQQYMTLKDIDPYLIGDMDGQLQDVVKEPIRDISLDLNYFCVYFFNDKKKCLTTDRADILYKAAQEKLAQIDAADSQ